MGTTSFRTKDFNKTIERQLVLLDEFWRTPENKSICWCANKELQTRYYDYMQQHGFVEGEAKNKPKDAREKTSGLVDIGLIYENRHLTESGRFLLDICLRNDFDKDKFFQIPKDSYLYFKQLLKTYNCVNGSVVRPFIVLIYVMLQLEYLSADEFTYLLPLCTNPKSTSEIISQIKKIRNGTLTLDKVILDCLMRMDNYKDALDLLKRSKVDEDLFCEIGLNRKSRTYDKQYYLLYQELHAFYIEKNEDAFSQIYMATRKIKIGKYWRSYIFNTTSKSAICNAPKDCKNKTIFDFVHNENEFKEAFFRVMHLFKAKATLSDYFDLNRRYVKITDTVVFEDNLVKLDLIPKYFFKAIIEDLYKDAYAKTTTLVSNCTIEKINPCLILDEQIVIDGVRSEFKVAVSTITEALSILEDNRYLRLKHLIDTKFTDDKLLTLLNLFEQRKDSEIRNMVTDNADIPTIFEYILAILWYRISERRGKILDYMKLSLDADLLPKTHAKGGEADIVYEYEETDKFPAHTLLIEATLADKTNQRRMEMEPVSRHLGQHLIKNGNLNSYCVFATNYLNINVISDFRSRKTTPYYNQQNITQYVNGMKIIPIEINELKKIIKHNRTYEDLYVIFEAAFNSSISIPDWYNKSIVNAI